MVRAVLISRAVCWLRALRTLAKYPQMTEPRLQVPLDSEGLVSIFLVYFLERGVLSPVLSVVGLE